MKQIRLQINLKEWWLTPHKNDILNMYYKGSEYVFLCFRLIIIQYFKN